MPKEEPNPQLWERVLTDPKYLLGAVGVTGVLAVAVWVLIPSGGTGDGIAETGQPGALFASRAQEAAASPKKRERRKRERRSLMPAEPVFGDEDGAPIPEGAAPPSGSPVTGPAGVKGRLQPSDSPSEPEQVGEAQVPAVGEERFEAQGTLGKRDFGSSGKFSGGGASAGGGGGGASMTGGAALAKAPVTAGSARAAAPAMAAAPRAKGGSMLRAAAGFTGGSAGPSVAAAGARPASGAGASPGPTGATGFDTSPFGWGGTGRTGGPGTAPPVPPSPPVEAAGPVGSGTGGGSGGGSGSGGRGGGEFAEGGDRGPAAKAAELVAVSGELKRAADALETNAARPALAETARLAESLAAASAGASGDMAAFKARVDADQAYFTSIYNAPDIAANLDGVEEALHDSQDGIVERLDANAQRLNGTRTCLQRYATGSLAAGADLSGAGSCARTAESGLDQRDSDVRKINSLKLAAEGWAQSAAAEVRPGCPKPARPPATAKEIAACNALDYIAQSAGVHSSKLGGASSRLDGVGPGSSGSSLAEAVDDQRRLVGEQRSLVGSRSLPPGVPSSELRQYLDRAVLSLDTAAGSLRQSAGGSLPAGQRAGEAARGTSKLMEGLAEVREASRLSTIVSKNQPKQ